MKITVLFVIAILILSCGVPDYDLFIRLGGWKALKEQGKLRLEGRDYVMQPQDVVEFMIGS